MKLNKRWTQQRILKVRKKNAKLAAKRAVKNG